MGQVTETSRNAYQTIRVQHAARTQTQKISTLLMFEPCLTRHEISKKTGICESRVSARVNEMLKSGLVVVAGKRRCSVTGIVVQEIDLAHRHASAEPARNLLF